MVYGVGLASTIHDIFTQVAIDNIEEQFIENLFFIYRWFVADDALTRSGLRLLYSLFHPMHMMLPL
jgi:hypothetical protein